ncbi:hypothetical protein Enr10x_16630 [Gimesia panareensis]|uniref:Uncharacterized protein n=1 Tax=Gimesia panareensis TaxID=2527978 RepID=A0A517Q404_9PLAN|nr:hypothetical protein [Gimesia panareensis]QDT26362.1 hypothetical protein Enr10x_16630 [Gimesia panareensis]
MLLTNRLSAPISHRITRFLNRLNSCALFVIPKHRHPILCDSVSTGGGDSLKIPHSAEFMLFAPPTFLLTVGTALRTGNITLRTNGPGSTYDADLGTSEYTRSIRMLNPEPNSNRLILDILGVVFSYVPLSNGDSVSAEDDSMINAGVKVHSTGASVALSAGDDLFLSAGIAREKNVMFNKYPSSSSSYLIESGETAFPSSPRRHAESGHQRPDPASIPDAGDVSGGLEEAASSCWTHRNLTAIEIWKIPPATVSSRSLIIMA